jgi:hypothetical protein
MTNQQIIDLCKSYIERLDEEWGVYKAVRNDKADGPYEHLCHCKWMLAEIPKFLEENQEKAMRWIGFVQGVFWSNGIYSVYEMREHNR